MVDNSGQSEQLEKEISSTVHRILSEREGEYRAFLEGSTHHGLNVFRNIAWVFVTGIVFLSGVGMYMYGKSMSEFEQKLEAKLNTTMVDLKVDDRINDTLSRRINMAVDDTATRTRISDKVNEEVDRMAKVKVGQNLTDAINRKIEQILPADLGYNLLPPKTIVIWYQEPNRIPLGWAICDGNNGTPNLVGRHIIGTNQFGFEDVRAGLRNVVSADDFVAAQQSGEMYRIPDSLNVIFIMKLSPVCGNDLKETGEECDGDDGVPEDCSCSTYCILDCSKESTPNK